MNRNVFIHEIRVVLRLPEFAEKMINKKIFILTSPIGGQFYYVAFHNTRYNLWTNESM
jgi:hypothetical protein